MRVTDETVELIKRWEGCRLKAYQDGGGTWTIGYGHSERAPTPPEVRPGMMITQKDAERILRRDLEHFADRVRPLMPEGTPDRVFGACLSLAFNVGLHGFAESTCLRRLHAGDREGAAEALTWWNKDNGDVVQGLVSRREDEARMMLSSPRPEPRPETSPFGSETKAIGGIVAAIIALVVGYFAIGG